MIDPFGRTVKGLRVSLTQRCNLKCVYCHHEGEGGGSSEMTLDEVLRMMRVAKSVGVRRVKYTGGEPLLRLDLAEIIGGTVAMGMDDVAITTNGTLLKQRAHALWDAGLRRINVSLPSVRPCVYASLTKGALAEVFSGIKIAKDLGIDVKINAVIMKDINDDEVDELLGYARGIGGALQLIELEDLNLDAEFFRRHYFDLSGVESRLSAMADRVETRGEMNNRKRYLIGSLTVEVVRPANSAHFCANCTRLRVTSDGRLKPCLMRSDNLIDALGPMRSGCSDSDIRRLFEEASKLREPYYRQAS